MSQRITVVSAKVGIAIILPPAPDDGQRPFGLFGTVISRQSSITVAFGAKRTLSQIYETTA